MRRADRGAGGPLRPVLFEAFGLGFQSARVFAGLAALTAYLWFEVKRAELELSENEFWGLMAALALGVFAGAIGLYAAAYGAGWSANVAYWGARKDIAGGSVLGAWAGAAAAAALFCRARGRPFAPVADALGAAAPLGLAVMRVGCILGGCCGGKPTALPWGLRFGTRAEAVHPTQLYEAVAALAIFAAVWRLAKPRGPLARGEGLALSAGLYGAARFAVDFARAGDAGVLAPLGLTSAQWIAGAVAIWAAARGLRRAPQPQQPPFA